MSRIKGHFVYEKKTKNGKIIKYNKLKQKLFKKYNKNQKAFNTRVLSINTKIIKKNTINKLVNLYLKYKEIIFCADQPLINLLYYKKWEKLPVLYNLRHHEIKHSKVTNVINYHCFKPKPWDPESKFYNEWKNNLKKADQIDLQKRKSPKQINIEKVKKISKYLEKKYYKKT